MDETTKQFLINTQQMNMKILELLTKDSNTCACSTTQNIQFRNNPEIDPKIRQEISSVLKEKFIKDNDPRSSWEPIYLNMFQVSMIMPDPYSNKINIDSEIIEMTLDIKNKCIQFLFEDNISPEGEMIVFPKLLEMDRYAYVIPKCTISMHNTKGEVYLRYNFKNLKIIDFDPLIQCSTKKTDVRQINSKFQFDDYTLEYKDDGLIHIFNENNKQTIEVVKDKNNKIKGGSIQIK